jgi:S1-C subfamily serine protease
MKKYLKATCSLVVGIILCHSFIFEKVQAEIKPNDPYMISDMSNNNGSFGFQEVSNFLASDSIDGYINPKSGELSFKPNENVTRAQFAKLLLNAMGIKPQKMGQKFTDVMPNTWYTDYVNTAESLGIISGYKNGTFKPGDNITRGQVSAMIVRAFNKTITFPNVSQQKFTDVSSKTTFAKEINQAASLKIISGYSDGLFKSANQANRAQAVVMITRALSKEKPKVASDQAALNVVLNYLRDEAGTYESTGFEIAPLSKLYNSYGSGYFHTFALKRVEDSKRLLQNESTVSLSYSGSVKEDILFLSDRYAEISISNAPTHKVISPDGKVVKLDHIDTNGVYSLKNTTSGWKIYNFSQASSSGIFSQLALQSSGLPNIDPNRLPPTLKDIIRNEVSVVTLIAYDENNEAFSQGTGFIVSNRLIASNFHVVDGATRVEAILHSESRIEIEGITEYDPGADLVLLKSKTDLKNTPLKLGSFGMVEKGDEVVAIGNPEGLTNTVSNGIVSSLREFRINNNPYSFIQFTAPITYGSSGGPLFNMDGYVIGITSMGYDYGNLNFAIAIDDVKNWVQKYRSMPGADIPVISAEPGNVTGEPLNQDYVISEKETIKINDINMAGSIVHPDKPFIYMTDKDHRRLVIINYETKEISTVPLNYLPSGLSLSEDGSKLYIANRNTKFLVSIYDLSKNEMVTHVEHEIEDITGYEDIMHRHVYEQDQKTFVVIGTWAPKLIILDALTYKPIEIPTIEGVGSMVFSKDNKYFYYWYQYGWGAGWAGSNIYKYSIDGNTLTEVDKTNLGYSSLYRDPLDAPIILLEDREQLISKQHLFDSKDLSVINIFPETILAASSELNIAVGTNGAYNLNNTLHINSLAFDLTNYNIQHMEFKQNNMFIFNKQGSNLLVERRQVLKNTK